MYKSECLEELRRKIDLCDVLSAHIDLRRAGSSYKALCPFHDEKSPSFVVQKGDSHYHCYGCGAHGDAIAFLMSYLKMSFSESVEMLAERFSVPLERTEKKPGEPRGPNKKELRFANTFAAEFFHYYLLHTDEGHAALQYLYQRGLDLDFIRLFQIGFAPRNTKVFMAAMQKKGFHPKLMQEAGLLSQKGMPYFGERIVFPILDGIGNVIGFSGRKVRDETFGPKYLNTPETPLFKKSEVLFGLHASRKRIAKERKVIIVEGQIDALRLIQEGYNFTVAGQGTAFGAEHVKQLVQLGVNQVFLAFDGDEAGRAASIKVGNLFQKEGIAVLVVPMEEGMDPDQLMREKGPPAFAKLLERGIVYLNFVYSELCKKIDPNTPSGKSEIVDTLVKQIRGWEHPLMVHETLRKLATLTEVPEKLIGVETAQAPIFIQRVGTLGKTQVDPDRILETDLLRWLFLTGETNTTISDLIKEHIRPEHFQTAVCKRVFAVYLKHGPCDLLGLATKLDHPEDQLYLSEIMQKRVNPAKAEEGAVETVRRILEREWMREREEIKRKIQQGGCSEEEMIDLAKAFDALKANRPVVTL